MSLSKNQREVLKGMFGGRCAYCGCELGDRWHADHVEPVVRQLTHVQGKGFVATGKLHRPENNRHDNLFPSCISCNIDKHSNSLEGWRIKLQQGCEVLRRTSATYKHSMRFGLVQETGAPIVFHFERINQQADKAGEQA